MFRSKNNVNRPRRCTPRELSRVSVVVMRLHPCLWLCCAVCQDCWSPMLRTGGKLPRGYWKCPQGCNHSQ